MDNILTIQQIIAPGHRVKICQSPIQPLPKTFSGEIVELKETGFLLTVQDEEFLQHFRSNMEIVIQFETETGLKYVCGIYHIYQAGDLPNWFHVTPWKANITLIHEYFNEQFEFPWKINRTSLRRFFRVEVNLPFYYWLQETVCIGQILDLSVSGLFTAVNYNCQLQQGITMKFLLRIPNQPSIDLFGEIIRVQEIETTKLGLGIQFLNPSREVQKMITDFLWQRKNQAS